MYVQSCDCLNVCVCYVNLEVCVRDIAINLHPLLCNFVEYADGGTLRRTIKNKVGCPGAVVVTFYLLSLPPPPKPTGL